MIVLKNMQNFKNVLNDFQHDVVKLKVLTDGSANNYKTWLNQLDTANGGKTMEWILDALTVSIPKNVPSAIVRLDAADKYFRDFTAATPIANQNDTHSAYIKLAIYVMSFFDAGLDIAISYDDYYLANMVARTAIFAGPDVVEKVMNGMLGSKENLKKGNEYASWDCMTSMRGLPVGSKVNGIILDDNTRANLAIKKQYWQL